MKILLAPLGVALAYFLLGHVSFLTASSHGIVTPVVFLPEGVALAAGILAGPRIASGVVLGQWVLALSRGQSWELALAIALINGVENLLGILLARRWGIGPRLGLATYGRLIVLIFFILQPFSATLGVTALWSGGAVTTVADAMRVGLSWWVGNTLAQALLVPLLLSAVTEPWAKTRQALWNSVLPAALLIPAVGFLFFSPFAQHQGTAPLLLTVPLLLWLAERGGIAAASLVTTLLVVTLLFLTGQGHGPFIGEGGTRVFELNVLILGLALTPQAFSMFEAERKRMEVERNSLLEQMRINASVFSSTLDGVLITDARRRIIDTNAAFTAISGYERDEVLGRDPKCLASGLTAPEVYADLWRSLTEQGFWRGELINRHKNGQVYAKNVAITAVRREDGDLSHYVAVIDRVNPLRDDPLTGLPSRGLVHERLAQAINRAHFTRQKIALIIVGLDRLRAVNLTRGHVIGDLLLRVAAQRLAGCLPADATLGRLRGDEFVILLDEGTDAAEVDRVVQCLLGAAAQPHVLGEERLPLSFSLGVASYPDDAQSLKDLLWCADLALHAAKDEGGARCHSYRPELQQQALERKWLEENLRRAVEEGHFFLHFQPIVHLATGAVTKAEALLRWRHPVEGLISPARFIPAAENLGLIRDIDAWLLREVATTATALRQQQPKMQISINVSPRQLLDERFDCRHYTDTLARVGLPSSALVLEITEGLLLEGNGRVMERLSACRDAGIQIALDDFGTGYSSLSYLNRFEIDFLKIDQSFVRTLQPGGKEHALCEAIVAMAHKLGLRVIAEGIETEAQCQLLKDMGCDFGQGFLFAKPLPCAELRNVLPQG